MAKVIKLQNGTETLLPISDANYIQMTVDNTTKSVQDVILENEEVFAAAMTDLNSQMQDISSQIENIPDEVTESTVSGWGFTKNQGTITGINMNGASKGTSGVVDLGTVLTSHQNIKTINSNTITGTGNVSVGTITGITMNGVSKGTSGVVNLGTVITSETSLSKGNTSGSGNAVTDISVNGHQITLTKGSTFLTSGIYVTDITYGGNPVHWACGDDLETIISAHENGYAVFAKINAMTSFVNGPIGQPHNCLFYLSKVTSDSVQFSGIVANSIFPECELWTIEITSENINVYYREHTIKYVNLGTTDDFTITI